MSDDELTYWVTAFLEYCQPRGWDPRMGAINAHFNWPKITNGLNGIARQCKVPRYVVDDKVKQMLQDHPELLRKA